MMVPTGHQSLSDTGTRLRPWGSLEIGCQVRLNTDPANHCTCEPVFRYRVAFKSTADMKGNEVNGITYLCKSHIHVMERNRVLQAAEKHPFAHTITPDSFRTRLHIFLYLFVTFISSLILNFLQLLFFLHLLICFRYSLRLSPLFKFLCISLFSHLDCCSSFFYNIPKLQHTAFVK